ncbi:MAG: hypothetical protein M3352_10720, partial [Bacteroidota bacterium]|nr:hypothetical protein [Bacteroidota bacterium]
TTTLMKETMELYLEAMAEDGVIIPSSKGLRYHIEQGIFDESQVAEEYYIAQVEVHLPKVTA